MSGPKIFWFGHDPCLKIFRNFAIRIFCKKTCTAPKIYVVNKFHVLVVQLLIGYPNRLSPRKLTSQNGPEIFLPRRCVVHTVKSVFTQPLSSTVRTREFVGESEKPGPDLPGSRFLVNIHSDLKPVLSFSSSH
jgi:hypothetical protein